MQRRNGENGSGVLVFAKRFYVIGALIFAAGTLQAQVLDAADQINTLQQERTKLENLLREQAEQNGRIDERTQTIQTALGQIILRLDAIQRSNGNRSN